MIFIKKNAKKIFVNISNLYSNQNISLILIYFQFLIIFLNKFFKIISFLIKILYNKPLKTSKNKKIIIKPNISKKFFLNQNKKKKSISMSLRNKIENFIKSFSSQYPEDSNEYNLFFELYDQRYNIY